MKKENNLFLQPLVSVVTPFYNTEKYLSECIQSVLAQSYQNWEFILVNNCSTDRSFEIAQSYAQKDARICVLSNDVFLGQIQNYNHALRQISAESKYCKIVQADDWIFPECLMQMVTVAEANSSVGIVSSYYLSGEEVKNVGLPYPSTVVPGREICRLQLLKGLFFFGSPTTILIRSDLIRNHIPFYSESSLNEDTEACYEILQNSDFGFVHQVLSFTRTENESISLSLRNFQPHRLENLIYIKKYGHIYLNSKEYEERSNKIEKKYFLFLGESALHRRDKKFWEYHENGLHSIGYRLNSVKLAKYILLAIMDLLLNPKGTVERLIKRYKIKRRIKKAP